MGSLDRLLTLRGGFVIAVAPRVVAVRAQDETPNQVSDVTERAVTFVKVRKSSSMG